MGEAMQGAGPIAGDAGLVAYCGLYCGACRSRTKGRCPGCHENSKATWCTVRKCCMDKSYASCADCKEFADPMGCGKYNNFIARVVGFVLRSDRAGRRLGGDGGRIPVAGIPLDPNKAC